LNHNHNHKMKIRLLLGSVFLIYIGCFFIKEENSNSCLELEGCYIDKVTIDSSFCKQFRWEVARSFSIKEGNREILIKEGSALTDRKWIINEWKKGLTDYGSVFLRITYQKDSIDVMYPIFGYGYLHPIKEGIKVKKGVLVDLSNYPLFLCSSHSMTIFFRNFFSDKVCSKILMEFNQKIFDYLYSSEQRVFLSDSIKLNDFTVYHKQARDSLILPELFVESSDYIFINWINNWPYNDYYISFWNKHESQIKNYYIKNGSSFKIERRE